MVLISSLTSLIAPILINIWMNESGGLTSTKIIILLGVLVLSLIIEIILTYFRERFAEGFNISNAKSMLNDFFHLSHEKITDEGPTNLIERIAIAVNSYYQYFTGDAIKIWSNLLIIIVVIGMIATQNISLAVILLLLVPINYFGYKLLNKELMKHSKVMQESTSSGWQEILSITGQTDYLKQCSDYDSILRHLDSPLTKIYRSMAKVNVFAQISSKLLSSINHIVQIMIMAVVVYQFMINQTNPLVLIMYSIILPLYFSSMSTITNSNLNKRDMTNSSELLQEWKNNRENNGVTYVDEISTVAFNVDVLSIKGKYLASNIKSTFHKGDIVWVKGDSGTGKSTLMKLLPKFHATDTVLINGIDIQYINNQSLRENLNYLSQNIPIIKGTLRDNLFFNRTYSKEIEKKLLDEEILASVFEDKTMDTVISEDGANLSGGEKQKIAIARVLYDNVDVLILDEITSNIDKDNAVKIYHRIIKEHEDKIIFIISHDDLPQSFATKELELHN
jgi:subfamily B ATP-binding cassette protein MsbA